MEDTDYIGYFCNSFVMEYYNRKIINMLNLQPKIIYYEHTSKI